MWELETEVWTLEFSELKYNVKSQKLKTQNYLKAENKKLVLKN